MLDFGWAELFLIMAVAVLIIGPNEIPGVMRGLGSLFRRFQYMKHSISSQFNDFMDMDDLENSVNFEDRARYRHDGEADFDEAEADEDVMVALDEGDLDREDAKARSGRDD